MKALFHFSQVDKDNINDETIELLMPYLELEEYQLVARNASKAAEGLNTWVRAMVMYNSASKVVKPKLEALQMAEARLNGAMKEAEKKLQDCKNTLEGLQSEFQSQMEQKAKVEANAAATKKRMDKANSLIEGLKDEKRDGLKMASSLLMKHNLVGDCALGATFVSTAAHSIQSQQGIGTL